MRPNSAQQTKAERLLGVGRPTSHSRYWVAFAALLTIFAIGWVIRGVLSEGWDEQEFLSLGALSMALWQLCDAGGAFLYLRRGAEWGRALRVFGFAFLLPLSLALWTIGSWIESSGFVTLFALALGGFVAVVVARGAMILWWDARERGSR